MRDPHIGESGEWIAERYLVSRGYGILERQWRIRQGEIDLIVHKDGEIVFVEVKTRRSLSFGGPEEAVTAKKRERIRAATLTYLAEKGLEDRAFRIDVIAIIWDRRASAILRHLRNAVGTS
ncbi:YraN family protein [Patescibacteria group bacterium]